MALTTLIDCPVAPGRLARPILRTASHAPRPPWRPGFACLVVVFLGFGTLAYLSYVAHPGVGVLGWYTTILWTAPALTSVAGLVGGVRTALRLRKPQSRIFPPEPVEDLLLVVVPTIGREDTFGALERAVRSFCQHLPAAFPNMRVDVVVEEDCAAGDPIRMLARETPAMRIITVPRTYRTPNGTRFKARANHYAAELRLADGEARDDVWVLHMDDDTGVGADTTRSLAEFVAAQRLAGERGLHLGQGVLSYPRECSSNRLTWLADSIRPGCDISLFAASTGSGSPRNGLHGELLLIRASVEASIGWDFGPRSLVEDAEFALRFCERHPGRSGWFAGRSYGASPVTVGDFVRQRERWVWGLLELATNRTIPLRTRVTLARSVAIWVCGPAQHPAVVLLLGALLHDFDTSPATVALVPLWALSMAFLIWLYWEGLKVNASSSSAPRRTWWEPLVLLALLPLFSLWEVLGVLRGVMRFLRNAESTFTVIAKPM